MSKPVLVATKLYIPPTRPQLVSRPRLIERLNEGLHHKLTLISAPAGFGKTTLLNEWITSCERPAAWLSIDNGDNDYIRFLTYFIAAVQTVAVNVGEGAMAALHSSQPQPPSNESILTSLLNEVASTSDNFILVLDDYHIIDSKQIDDALVFLIERMPPQMHLVIATREDPDLPLARLRARDQLTELRITDLRFTASEAAEFLNHVMGLRLSADNITALENRTEGWIAGLQLAAISMQGHKDVTSFIQSFTGSHHFVMDYLVEEVLRQQPERVQSFLLQTSILERMCGSLCDAVLSDASAAGQQTLEYLERANLLVIPLDDKREWYRYHHLFADVLQARLTKEQPSQVASLHLRACTWWEQNNFRVDAIHHALAARDFEHAADLIELERSANIGKYFQSAAWLGWVKSLPDELVRNRPLLSIGFVWELLFLGELEPAEDRMKDVDRLLAEQKVDTDSAANVQHTNRVLINDENLNGLQISLAIARAFHAQSLDDALSTVKYAHQALSLISEEDYYTRGLSGSLLALAYLTKGDLENAHKHMADAVVRLQMADNLLFATTGIFVLADIRIAQGRLLDAISTYEQALQLVTAQGGSILPSTANLYLGLSKLYREQGNAEAARQFLFKSQELGKQAALDEWPYPLYLVQAQIKVDMDDLDGALHLLDEAERLHHRSPVPDMHPIGALKARVWIKQGRLTQAIGWAERRNLSINDDLSYMREFEHITLARILIANYKSDHSEHFIHEAIGLLERLLKAAEERGRLGSIIEILVVQALAHDAQGNKSLSIKLMERALTLARPEGYVRVFVDEGTPMLELLKQVKAESRETAEYIQKLLTAFEINREPPRTQPLVDPLSERELEVLRLIAQGLSNEEIGKQLFLALDTIKGHNRKIFDKLQVQRRTEAVARAHELGLL